MGNRPCMVEKLASQNKLNYSKVLTDGLTKRVLKLEIKALIPLTMQSITLIGLRLGGYSVKFMSEYEIRFDLLGVCIKIK